jgi:hypothetical protein
MLVDFETCRPYAIVLTNEIPPLLVLSLNPIFSDLFLGFGF